MATFAHGATIQIATHDISTDVTDVTFEMGNDVVDVTTYGNAAHLYGAALTDGKLTVSGLWDKAASTGSQTVIAPLVGSQPVAFVWGPEGSTSGKVKYTGNVVLDNYAESANVADLVKFTASFKCSGAVTVATFP